MSKRREAIEAGNTYTRLTLKRLHEGELDIGVLTLPVLQPKLRILDLGRDELIAIVAPTHAWAERKRIQPSEFGGQPLLIYERRSQTYALIERVLLETGVFPQIAMEMDHLEAVVEMVRVGLGVAIVPRWAIRAEAASRTATEFHGSPTQKPSMAPRSSASTIRGGGTTLSCISLSGSMPAAACGA